jgi:hypothetical protein
LKPLIETPATSGLNTFNIHFELLKHMKPLVETPATPGLNINEVSHTYINEVL